MEFQGDAGRKIPDLLSPLNLIASVPNNGQNRVSISTGNLERIINGILNRHPELSACPIAIISVLGSDLNKHRTFYTDWLMHYFSGDEGKKGLHGWHNPEGSQQKLRYIGTSCQESEVVQNAVFVWQPPFLLAEVATTGDRKGRPSMVIFVIYSRGNEHAELMDRFSACISTNVLTFNEAQMKRVMDFRHSVAQSGHESDKDFRDDSGVHILQPKWPTSGINESWNQFVADIGKIALNPVSFKGEMLTMTNFIPFLNAMVHTLNQSTQIPGMTEVNSGQQEANTNTDDPAETNSGILANDGKEAEETGTEKQIPQAKDTEHIKMAPSAEDEINMKIKDLTGVMISTGTYEDKINWYQIFSNLVINVKNMHDNYVCFQGKRDGTQMKRFLESAYQRAKQEWMESGVDTNCFSLTMLDEGKTNIFKTQEKDNAAIIAREKEHASEVIKRVKTTYKEKLKEYMLQGPSLHSRRDFESIHQKMKKHCIAVVARSMNYSGKLNNVVHEKTKKMEESIKQYFETEMASLDFMGNQKTKQESELEANESSNLEQQPLSNQIEAPLSSTQCIQRLSEETSPDPIHAYNEHMKKLMPPGNVCDIMAWRKEHDGIVGKVSDGLGSSNKDELVLILETHWISTVEAQFFTAGLLSDQPGEHCLGIHLTNQWVSLLVGNDTLSRPIFFPGFPAAVACWRENPPFYKWGHDAITGRHEYPPHHLGYLLHFISNGMGNAELTKDMLTNFILGTKGMMENTFQLSLHGLLLTVPSWLTFTERNLLRECSNLAGFKGFAILTESSLAAYQHFCSIHLPHDGSQDFLLLVIIARAEFIRLEIFGRHIENGEIKGVWLLGIASEKWPQIDSPPYGTHYGTLPPIYSVITKQLYGNALAQLEQTQRTVNNFLVTTEVNGWENVFDAYFLHEEKMTKLGSIGSLAYNGLSTLCMSRTRLHNFLYVLATAPKSVAYKWLPRKPSVANKEQNNSELIKQKASLLEKCGRMEAQISDGSVQVGRLTMRIIMTAINNCKLAAAEDMVDGDEAKEIDELFKIHNFK